MILGVFQYKVAILLVRGFPLYSQLIFMVCMLWEPLQLERLSLYYNGPDTHLHVFYCSQDKSVKCTVYRILGSIPAANYIQLPKTQSQSLGLTGRYLYLLFHPVPGKYFVVHMDVATQDGLIVRVSFSNLFKEFKSTSTWLQFPFVCHAAKGSIHAHAGETAKGKSRNRIGEMMLKILEFKGKF